MVISPRKREDTAIWNSWRQDPAGNKIIRAHFEADRLIQIL